MSSLSFTPKATAEENKAEGDRWLLKAISLENEKKSPKMVDMALERAAAFENAWYDMVHKK